MLVRLVRRRHELDFESRSQLTKVSVACLVATPGLEFLKTVEQTETREARSFTLVKNGINMRKSMC